MVSKNIGRPPRLVWDTISITIGNQSTQVNLLDNNFDTILHQSSYRGHNITICILISYIYFFFMLFFSCVNHSGWSPDQTKSVSWMDCKLEQSHVFSINLVDIDRNPMLVIHMNLMFSGFREPQRFLVTSRLWNIPMADFSVDGLLKFCDLKEASKEWKGQECADHIPWILQLEKFLSWVDNEEKLQKCSILIPLNHLTEISPLAP